MRGLSPEALGVLLRTGLFVLLAWTGLLLFPPLMQPLAGVLVSSALSSFAAGAVANAVGARVFEQGKLSDFGLGSSATAARELGTGVVAGFGAAVVILAVALVLQLATFESVPAAPNAWANLLFLTLVLVFGAVGEELIFHGYAFQLLMRSVGEFATILPVGVLFGLVHLNNQNVTLLAVVNTMGWGVLLGYAYLRTRALWLPIGMHFGWNFAMPLFGVNLSGFTMGGFTMGMLGFELRWRTGVLWSGGAYGLEGSLFTTMVVAGLFFALRRLTPGELIPGEDTV